METVKQMQKKPLRRSIAILLSSTMILSSLSPVAVLAKEAPPIQEEQATYQKVLSSTATVTQDALSKKEEAIVKIRILEALMEKAKDQGITDTFREETVVWMATEFLKFADYDEANPDVVSMLYGAYSGAGFGSSNASNWGDTLHEFEREEVVEMLDLAIAELQGVISGDISRVQADAIDWDNVGVDLDNGNFVDTSGDPVFLFDYFSKTQQGDRADPRLYNDYIGNLNPPNSLSMNNVNDTGIDMDAIKAGKTTLLEELNRLKTAEGDKEKYALFIDRYYSQILGAEDYYTGLPSHGNYDGPYVDYWGNTLEKNDMTGNIGYQMLWNSGTAYQDWFIGDKDYSLYSTAEGKAGVSKYTQFDIDLQGSRDLWQFILEDYVPQVADKSAVDMGYILTNEPHFFTDVRSGNFYYVGGGQSEATLAKFQDYLKEVYDNDITKLKASWTNDTNPHDDLVWTDAVVTTSTTTDTSILGNINYITDFDDIVFELPFDGGLIEGTPQHYDWCRFNMLRVTDWFTFLSDTVVANDENAGTHMKLYPRVMTDNAGWRDHGMDLEALSRTTTYLGNDVTIRDIASSNETYEWADDYAMYWREMGLMYDLSNSFSPTTKVNVNSEGHAISINTSRNHYMESSYIDTAYWLSGILGEDSNTTWFWPRNGDGSPEATMFSDASRRSTYAGSVVTMPEVADGISQIFAELNAHGTDVAKFQVQERPLRIFYTETSNINDSNQINRVFDIYESVYFEGLSIGFNSKDIMLDTLGEGDFNLEGDFNKFDVTIIYDTPWVTDEEFNAIVKFAEAGNKIVMDNKSLLLDEHGNLRATSEITALKALSSVTVEESMADLATEALAEVTAAAVQLDVTDGKSKGLLWRVVEESDGSFLVTGSNLGNQAVSFDIAMADKGSTGNIVDKFSGQAVTGTQTLAPLEIFFYHVNAPKAGITPSTTATAYNPVGSAYSVSNKTVIAWETVVGADSYNVYEVKDGVETLIEGKVTANAQAFSPDQYANPDSPLTSEYNHLVLSGVAQGDYTYVVKAVVNDAEVTGATYEFDCSSTGYLPADIPENVTATGSTTANFVIALKWDTTDNAVGYNVYLSETENGTYTQFNNTPILSTSYSLTPVANGKDYYIKVVAVDVLGYENKLDDVTAVKGRTEGLPAVETATSGISVMNEAQSKYFSFDAAGYQNLGYENSNEWYSVNGHTAEAPIDSFDAFCGLSVIVLGSTTNTLMDLTQLNQDLDKADGDSYVRYYNANNSYIQTTKNLKADEFFNISVGDDQYFMQADIFIPEDVGFIDRLEFGYANNGAANAMGTSGAQAQFPLSQITERGEWVTVNSTVFNKQVDLGPTTQFRFYYYGVDSEFFIDNIKLMKVVDGNISLETEGTGTATLSTQNATAGEKVTISVTGEVESISVTGLNDSDITNNHDGTYSFTMPTVADGDVITVKVEFTVVLPPVSTSDVFTAEQLEFFSFDATTITANNGLSGWSVTGGAGFYGDAVGDNDSQYVKMDYAGSGGQAYFMTDASKSPMSPEQSPQDGEEYYIEAKVYVETAIPSNITVNYAKQGGFGATGVPTATLPLSEITKTGEWITVKSTVFSGSDATLVPFTTDTRFRFLYPNNSNASVFYVDDIRLVKVGEEEPPTSSAEVFTEEQGAFFAFDKGTVTEANKLSGWTSDNGVGFYSAGDIDNDTQYVKMDYSNTAKQAYFMTDATQYPMTPEQSPQEGEEYYMEAKVYVEEVIPSDITLNYAKQGGFGATGVPTATLPLSEITETGEWITVTSTVFTAGNADLVPFTSDTRFRFLYPNNSNASVFYMDDIRLLKVVDEDGTPPEEATITGIAVNSQNHKTEYTVGDTLDVSELTIAVSYSDGTTKTVPVTADMVSGFDSTMAIAKQTLTISYEECTSTYVVEIKEEVAGSYPLTFLNDTPDFGHVSLTVDGVAITSGDEIEVGTEVTIVANPNIAVTTVTASATIDSAVVTTADDTAENDDVVTENDDDAVTSEDDTVTNGDDTATNGDDTVTSDDETVTSDDDAVTNDDDAVTSDDDAVTSDDDAVTSDDETVTSDDDTVTSDDDAVTSDDDAVTSDDDAVTSDDDAVTNDDDAVTSDDVVSYELDYVKLNGQLWEAETFIMPAMDLKVEVAFKEVGSASTWHKVTVKYNEDHGSAYVDSETHEAGENVLLKWEANSGYELDTVTVDGKEVAITGTSYTFEMPADDVSIEVTFKAIIVESTYTISFDANGGSVATNSSETGTDGTLSSLPTASRTGYSFNGWYTVISGGSKISTSTVFDSNTTVYAQWTANPVITPTPDPTPDTDSGSTGGSGSSSGGSSSGGGTSSTPSKPSTTSPDTTSPDTTTPDTTTPESSTVVTKDPESTGNSTSSSATVTTESVEGKVEATVDDEIFDTLVSATVESSKDAENRPEVVITVETSDDAKAESVEVTLSTSSLETLAQTETGVLTVESEVGSITFDNQALTTITKDSSETYTIAISQVSSSSLNDKQTATVGNSPVYDLSVISSNGYVTDFDGGYATVKLPYTLKSGENPNCLYVYYVDSNGNINKMQTMYDAQNQVIVFNTSHFSVFTIVHELLSLIFNDVDENDWHFDYVSYAYQNDLFGGTSKTAFSPDTAMSRGMLVQTLNSYERNPEATVEANYPDVQSNQWFAAAVDWATERNIVSGMKNGTFAPDESVTREQLALILFNYAKDKGYDMSGSERLSSFPDADSVSSWAEEALSWAYGNGLITGMNGKLSPDSFATRAQVAVILKNFINLYA